MSKDRQNQQHVPVVGPGRKATMELTEHQKPTVTRIGDQIAVTVPPGAKGPDVEAAVAEHDRHRGSYQAFDQFGQEVPMPADLARDLARDLDAAAAKQAQAIAAKPPANIPKSVHHLRKAVSVMPMVRDPIGEAMQKIAVALLEDPTITCHDNARRILPGIAAALDLDVHAGPAAKDVRAAIEALS